MVPMDSRIICALGLAASMLFSVGCSRQVCECAVHVGGTTPASGAESEARGDAVAACLERHGGGTISGCPMPPSMPPDREPASESAELADTERPTEVDESDAPTDPFEPLRDLIVAIDHGDVEGMVRAFHPALEDEVRGELEDDDDDISTVRTCIERTIEIGVVASRNEPSQRLTEMGITGTAVLGLDGGDGRKALVMLHQGRYVLVDTGC